MLIIFLCFALINLSFNGSAINWQGPALNQYTDRTALAQCSTTLYLPQPTGKFGVGTKAFEVQNPQQKMLRDQRPLRFMMQAFYPSDDASSPSFYMPGTIENGQIENSTIFSWARPNAEFAKSKQLPIIFYVPGRGDLRQSNSILCEELASHGYIVLSLDLPYVAHFVKFLDGTSVVATLYDIWKVPRDRDYRYQFNDEAVGGQISAINFMLKNLELINAVELNGRGNTGKIAIIGHSLGGNVANLIGLTTKEISAVVDLDSAFSERPIFGHCGPPENSANNPVLFVRGMAPGTFTTDKELTRLKQISHSSLWTPKVDHETFSDVVFFDHKIKNFGKRSYFKLFCDWFFKLRPLYSRENPNPAAFEGQTVDDWHSNYRQKIVGWLKKQFN